MNLHTLRRLIVFVTALILGIFLSSVEGTAQRSTRTPSEDPGRALQNV